MSAFRCDLHIHSCLSPCGDEEMTPGNIAGVAKLNGLDIAALTDHNTTGNCASFFAACETYGVIPVAGMELTTSEDVHLLCFFPTLMDATAFSAAVDDRRIKIKNKPEIFGRQLLIDLDDEPCGEEEFLLINATTLSLEEAARLCRAHGGAAIPAHIDREANGMLSVLGGVPEEPDFSAVEVHDPGRISDLAREHPVLRKKRTIVSSDAHRLWEIAEPGFPLNLSCESGAGAQQVRDALIDYLSGQGRGGII
ncbi:MAG: PHP domain-containing protein [Eubacteriales bacterium]|nr:PHP domain-containing protein [Eubacteriales bacterium]